MHNVVRINGDDFYLCRVVGLLKNDGKFAVNAGHCGLFAYLRSDIDASLPDALRGVIEDEEGKPLPIAIHNDVVQVVREAFDADAGILLRIQSIKSLQISIIDAAVSLATALTSNKHYE